VADRSHQGLYLEKVAGYTMHLIRDRVLIPLLISFLFTASISAATVDGIPIHSSTNGKGRRTVSLVHGWNCDETMWQLQVPALAGDYRVITLDLPGYGQSGSPKDGTFSMDLFARTIEAVRSEAKANRLVLVGHGTGTPIIIQYARLYAKRALALVFVDGPFKIPPNLSGVVPFPPEAFFWGVPILNEIDAPYDGPAILWFELMIKKYMFSPSTTPEMQNYLLSMMSDAKRFDVILKTSLAAKNAMADPAIWKDDVFTQPILGLYADRSFPYAREMKTRFPNLELHKIAGTGHFLMLEKPEEFNRLLKSFLDKQKF
jgi:sigma-B regulation protein RsbQ